METARCVILPLKRVWFARIWNGEKNVEYREKKPYWDKRIRNWMRDEPGMKHGVVFQIGYSNSGPRMFADVYKVDVGKCPYDGWDGEFYRIHFGNVRRFNKENGEMIYVGNPGKMNERKE